MCSMTWRALSISPYLREIRQSEEVRPVWVIRALAEPKVIDEDLRFGELGEQHADVGQVQVQPEEERRKLRLKAKLESSFSSLRFDA